MRRYYFITISMFICCISVFGQAVKQKKSKFYNITEVGYGHGIGKINLKKSNQKIDNNGYLVRLRTQFGYFLNDQFSCGLGFGLDGYHDFTANTAPLFFDARYYTNSIPQSFFILSNFGYSVPLANNFEQGFMGGIAIGKRISTRKLILLPSIGINIQQVKNIKDFTIGTEDFNLVTISFNLGLMF